MTIGAPMAAVTGPLADYHTADRTETAQLIKDARATDQLLAQIIKNSGNQKATDFFILKQSGLKL
ncbi:hypothetical protein FFR93_04780 [Rhizobium sp. MHM7A]|nr:hypothetical protein FFR93_04780 [Rhizobium sp. MHM7A]